jgi:TonB-linked SusC/RagA family outer membrane protein
MRAKFLIFTFLCSFSYAAIAQSRVVEGTVISSDEQTGMPGVNVVVKGTTVGTATDVNGKYRIEVPNEAMVLQFSFIGYVTTEETIGGRSAIDVTLPVDTETLNEVVVVGYGIQKKSDLTGSIASVRGADLLKVPSSNPMQALQGKVAGVQVVSSSGAPGAAPEVRIRGTGTFNNASPIYVVDGVILNDINFLNSADIQSMEVLKDASATAIYGSRGANGVVIITTKQGKKGDETPTVNFVADYSVQQLAKDIDMMNGREYAIAMNQIRAGSFNNVDAVQNTDWQKEIFRVAPMQNYQVSLNGSSARNTYYVSFGYFGQSGIIPKSKYERYTLKLNNTYTITKNIRFGNNITLAPYKQGNTSDGVVFQAYRAQPTTPVYNPDGTYAEVRGVGNPIAAIDYTNSGESALRSVGNFFGEVDFLKDFTFRSSFGVDFLYRKSKSFTPVYYVSPQQFNNNSRLTKGSYNEFNWLLENTLNYNKELGKHRINALVGYTTQQSSSENQQVAAQNLIREGKDFWYYNASNVLASDTKDEVDVNRNFSMISYLGRINYTYDDRYLFTATFRRDGSSKFSSAQRYANFPSFALGWNVINEKFMQDITAVTNLKVRASWGQIGNEKITYDRRYSIVSNNENGVFNDVLHSGATYGVTGNPDLKWETTTQTDAGMELGFFNNRLTAEVDYYNRVTDDVLVDLNVPGLLGNGINAKVTYNAAKILNRGFELTLGWQSEWKGLGYRFGIVGTTIHNEVLAIGGSGTGVNDALVGGDSGNGFVTRTTVGSPIGAFYGYKTDGVFQNTAEIAAYPHTMTVQPGDMRIIDWNNDGQIDDKDRTNLGSPIPKFVGGFNFELTYKGFDFSADFQVQTGNKIYNGKESIRTDLYNYEQHVANAWHGEGTSNTEPRVSTELYNYQPSDRFIQNGDFLRLRTLSFGYTIPQKIATLLKMKQARIYVRGNNIFTITKFTGYTPEISAPLGRSGDVLSAGIDSGVYPVSRVLSAGLNVTF